jgi:hypothetical protein
MIGAMPFVQADYCDACGDERPCECDKQLDRETVDLLSDYEPEPEDFEEAGR